MMVADDATVTILREIRDSIRALDERLTGRIDTLEERITVRLDSLDGRFDALTERVSMVEYAVKDCAGQVLMLTRYVKNKTEVEVGDLKVRVTKLEDKVG